MGCKAMDFYRIIIPIFFSYKLIIKSMIYNIVCFYDLLDVITDDISNYDMTIFMKILIVKYSCMNYREIFNCNVFKFIMFNFSCQYLFEQFSCSK